MLLRYQKIVSWGILVGFASFGLGCGNPYMPLDGFHVRINTNASADKYGYKVYTRICASESDEAAQCGVRKIDEEMYEKDEFVVTGPDFAGDFVFSPNGYESESIVGGVSSTFASASSLTDKFLNIELNGGDTSEVTVPDFPTLLEPSLDQEISRSGFPFIRFSWEPTNLGLPMHWRSIGLYNGKGSDPCDALTWSPLSGEEEDDGSFEIPMESFPAGLPEAGCNIGIIVARRKTGKLAPDIPQGYIHANAEDGVIFRLLP